jgi:hypothetical protein
VLGDLLFKKPHGGGQTSGEHFSPEKCPCFLKRKFKKEKINIDYQI